MDYVYKLGIQTIGVCNGFLNRTQKVKKKKQKKTEEKINWASSKLKTSVLQITQ